MKLFLFGGILVCLLYAVYQISIRLGRYLEERKIQETEPDSRTLEVENQDPKNNHKLDAILEQMEKE